MRSKPPAVLTNIMATPVDSTRAPTIIDVKTRKVVGTIQSEFGTKIYSEKLLDMMFLDGHLQRVSNQFGNEYGDFVTAEKIGVGPHMPVLPGRASTVARDTGKDPNEGLQQPAKQ